jgi:hypothetical protein
VFFNSKIINIIVLLAIMGNFKGYFKRAKTFLKWNAV